MKYQSIIINTNEKNLTLDKLTSILQHKVNISQKINNFNRIIIEDNEKNSIGVKEVSNLIEWSYLKHDELKFIIIYSSEKLTEEAQNSLLKLVEEPPEDLLIILITQNPEALLQTILSRCILINSSELFKIEDEGIVRNLSERLINAAFLDRIKIIDEIIADDSFSREKINLIINEILVILSSKEDIAITTLKSIKKIYKGIKKGTNIKLTLDYLNICLEKDYDLR